MNFHSVEYFLLLIFSAVLYFVIPFRFRWLLLLVVSYLFYGYSQLDFMWLLLVSTAIDFICGFYLKSSTNVYHRKMLLLASIITNLSILAYFKYRLLIDQTFVYLLDSSSFFSGPAAEFILPIGISFFTLQSMGYTIDVYRGKTEAETHFGLFALYVAYFPQLIAGPIERANMLLPQLKVRHNFDWERIRSGGLLILVGLFKKLVIVGSLSPLMDSVFSENANYTWFEAVLASTLSVFYIYMDFSSYTDIARGSARIYGVNLTENFKRPFSALSVRDFWQRWHMSLTKWIFDYLHQPLSSLFTNTYWRRLVAVLTFSIVGLWHGAAVNYILWGFANGVFVLAEALIAQWRLTWPKTKLWNYLRQLRTLFLINVTGVVFLSPGIEHATAVFQNIFSFDLSRYFSSGAIKWPLVIAALSIFSWYVVREYLVKYKTANAWPPRNALVRWSCYLILILSIVNFSASDQNAFIYFKF